MFEDLINSPGSSSSTTTFSFGSGPGGNVRVTRIVRGGARDHARGGQREQRGEPDGREDDVQCPICDNMFPKSDIEQHAASCTDESSSKVACPICSRKFPASTIETHAAECGLQY